MKKSIVTALALSLVSTTVLAAEVQPDGSDTRRVDGSTTIRVSDQVMTVSGRLSVGLAYGSASETVSMPPGLLNLLPRESNRLSSLTWDIDNVVMLGAGASIRPLSWLKFNADIALAVTKGNGNLEDYDYAAINTDAWTNYSRSDSDVKDSWMLDVNAELKVLQYQRTSLFGIVGYKHDKWSWEASGGQYIYSTYALRDTVGTLPNQLAISYDQTFDTPYIGLGFSADLNRVSLSGRFIFSPLVSADAEDTHHLRSLHYEDSMNNGRMYGVDLALTAPITRNFSLVGAYHYQRYDNLNGGESITDLTTGQSEY